MFIIPDPMAKIEREELDEYIKMLSGLLARLVADDVQEDHRRSPKVLNAKHLATTDTKRLIESLTAYRALLEEPPSGKAAASGR
jgi:hypothetical protein